MHGVVDRLQEVGADGHPAARRLAGQLHPVAAVDPLLAVQRQVVGVLADGHLGHQPRPGQPLLDRLGEPLGDDDVPLATLAGVLGPHVLQDDQAGRDVLELLADLLADPDPHRAAVGTGEPLGRDVVEDRLARQVGRQRLAAVATFPGRARRRRRRVGRRRRLGGRGLGGRQDLAGEEQELGGVDRLGLAAVPLAEEQLELVLELLGEVRLLDERLQQLADELMAGLQVGGQFAGRGRHAIITHRPARRDNKFSMDHRI